MIEHHSVELLCDRTLFDADISPDGAWIAIVGSEAADSAIYLGNEIRLHRKVHFPIVRLIDHRRFLVVDARAKTSDKNASLVTIDSPWKPLNFHAGDGVQDVLITTNYIVFTYFDEGVFGDAPISHEGLSVFDRDGAFCFGYQSRLGPAAVDVADCYAACHVNGDEIAFCAYTGFPLVNWNLKTGAHSAVRIPDHLHGPTAMTALRDDYFFHGSYKSRNTLFHYNNGNYRHMATHKCRLKTLRDGRFLRLDTDGFSVIDCRSAAQRPDGHGRQHDGK